MPVDQRVQPIFSHDGDKPMRPYVSAVRISRAEKQYYEAMHGSVGAALRNLINEDQKKRYDEQEEPNA